MKTKRLLIIEDDSTLKIALFRGLSKFGYAITTATTLSEGLTWIKNHSLWDAILLDLNLPDGDGLELLSEIKRFSPQIPVLVITGHGTIEKAVESIQKGAFNYLVKPINLDDVVTSLNAAINSSSSIETLSADSVSKESVKFSKSSQSLIVGESPEIKQVLELVSRVADSDATLMIQGESGTGKELIARAVHQMSPRKTGPFVAINCGAIPAELLESELFGHVKGAFTGAIANRVGKFESADGGILFLDEIGDMSPSLQVKILRALQERKFEPVGGTKTIQVDVQVIAATHINLEKAVATGQFREDLFYRLNVIPIMVPALRERKSDIPILIQHFINIFCKRRKESLSGFTAEALASLTSYQWPGNIRELENLVERLTIIKGKGFVELKDLPEKYHVKPELIKIEENSTKELNIPNDGLDFNIAVDQFENGLIISALEKTGWNKNQAAILLRLNRTTLVEKMKKKGLKAPDEGLDSNNELNG